MTAKILVADDSITIQKIVAMAFENEDATVEGINNGSEALARIKTFKPNIVLADIDMPGLTGFELSRKIKESNEFNSIVVLLLASDFEEFDETRFQASLADNHITKPFKSEDLVRKIMALLDNASPPTVADEDIEEVIELSVADRVIEDIVMDLNDDQQMDSRKEISLEEEEAILNLPLNQESTNFDDEAEPAETDLPVESSATLDDPAENEADGPEEDLDELLLKVEELSRKSEEISENGHHEKLSPMEAIDEMLKEVSALKEDSLFASGKKENNVSKTTEPQFSTDPTQGEAVVAEVDYISEENAEALATAFDEITNGNKNPFSEMTTDLPEPQESFSPEDAVESEPENPTEDFSDPFLSPPQENSLPNLEESPSPPSNGEPSSVTEKIVATGESEGDMEASGESPLPDEGQLNQFMEKEVRKILHQSLAPLIEKEISGLSEKILRAVEENVRQVTPGIAKTIIEKEIDKIKTMDDG